MARIRSRSFSSCMSRAGARAARPRTRGHRTPPACRGARRSRAARLTNSPSRSTGIALSSMNVIGLLPRDAVEQRLAGLAQLPRGEHGGGVGVITHAPAPGTARRESEANFAPRSRRASPRSTRRTRPRTDARRARLGHQVDVAAVLGVRAGELDHRVVEQFHRGGPGGQDRQHRVDRFVHAVEAEHREALGPGRGWRRSVAPSVRASVPSLPQSRCARLTARRMAGGTGPPSRAGQSICASIMSRP
jgi:hypothetical protein